MKTPRYKITSKQVLFIAGLGIGIWNSVWGDHNIPTFIFALTFCGLAPAISLDELIHRTDPAPAPQPAPADPAPVKEPIP